MAAIWQMIYFQMRFLEQKLCIWNKTSIDVFELLEPLLSCHQSSSGFRQQSSFSDDLIVNINIPIFLFLNNAVIHMVSHENFASKHGKMHLFSNELILTLLMLKLWYYIIILWYILLLLIINTMNVYAPAPCVTRASVSNHGIIMLFLLKISATCAISLWRNDKICVSRNKLTEIFLFYRPDVKLTAQLESLWLHREPSLQDQVVWTYMGTISGIMRVYPGVELNRDFDPTK